MFRLDIAIADNADFRHEFVWVDRRNNPVSLSGSTLEMHVKRKASDRKPLLVLNDANQTLVVNAQQDNQFTMTVYRGSLKPGDYVFDMIRIADDGARTRIAEGILRVEQGVTQ